MFWKMILGALTRQKGKPLMIAFAVGLGVSLATFFDSPIFSENAEVKPAKRTRKRVVTVEPDKTE